MSTAAVAELSGYSVQQVRDLERQEVIPPAARADNGYRRFRAEHVRALHAYRDLASAVGPVRARWTMREIRLLPSAEAAALIVSCHADLHRERERALAARRGLESVQAEEKTEAASVDADVMTIAELSEALGIAPSALRFWEGEGLVAPDRISTRAGTARRYGLAAIREARITAELRAGGYRVPEVREAITAIRELRDVSHSLAALDARLEAIAQRALALLRAGALLAEIIDPRRKASAREDQLRGR
ncbi:MerR family transcriptional regulator [Saccharopolyspora mangrovi]|uniref:MerR family transcriptional regulator n=1 Tax=Saccharopolyspora mangrovi TaxID=3082379 RepID=A0ABU6A7Y0_9PSEU|nr:MerR family transcriptional regulator [Saccharopolyspora sp. S2-29]MEB3367618.1 MerR family transcriptional regulator [Saccharopolyspora sp. S2-29]